jgi:hypothetical protein
MAPTDSSDIDNIQPYQNGAPSKVKLTIHNQCLGIELASPVYAGDGTTCYLSPAQKADTGSTMQVGFDIKLAQDESIGIFMYKLQRKNNDPSNEDTISSEEEAICTRHVFVWKAYKSGKVHVYTDIVEHDKDCVWDEDSLMKLAAKYKLYDIQHNPVKHTWLLRDNTEIMTSLNATREEEYYKLEMIISEGSIEDHVWRPKYIDMNM